MSFTEEIVCKRKFCREIEETQKDFPGFYEKNDNNNNNKKKKKKKKKKVECKSQQQRVKGYALISFKELPEYMKDNEFILNYYRANWPLKEAFFSIFHWHNETLNVWTHLVGFVLFLVLTMANLMELPHVPDLLSFLTRSLPISAVANVSHDSIDYFFVGTTKFMNLTQIVASQEFDIASGNKSIAQWPFFVFLGGSMFCLFSSSTCHLFSCHSHSMNILLLRIDYVGITTMIITSFFPPIYYIFQCDSNWHFLYLAGITIMGVFTIFTLLTPKLSSSKFRAFRAMLFSSMGLFGVVPAIHAVMINWYNNPQRNIILAYEIAMALFYLIGTAFYVSRIPERLKPGWFDIAGHSHQIFHVFVVMGALAHYAATLVILDWHKTYGCHKSI